MSYFDTIMNASWLVHTLAIPFPITDVLNTQSGILIPSLTVSLLILSILMFIILDFYLVNIYFLKTPKKNDLVPDPVYEEMQSPSDSQEFVSITANEAYGHIM